VLDRLRPGGFHHAAQSLRVVDLLERDGRGLNLSHEVRDGIRQHSKGKGEILLAAGTVEAQVVRISDLVAYLSHDVDDALRAGVIRREEIPSEVRKSLGETHGQRIDTMVRDVIRATLETDLTAATLSPAAHHAALALREFLYQRVYDNPAVHEDFVKASKLLEEIYGHCVSNPDWFLENHAQRIPGEEIETLVADFIAGMTDRYALTLYESIFMPQPWKIL
jgi:dGTPase